MDVFFGDFGRRWDLVESGRSSRNHHGNDGVGVIAIFRIDHYEFGPNRRNSLVLFLDLHTALRAGLGLAY